MQVYADPGSTDRDKELKPAAEKVFKELCSCQAKTFDFSAKASTLRVKKKTIKLYLTQRYNARIASKITGIFDFLLPNFDYSTFYK